MYTHTLFSGTNLNFKPLRAWGHRLFIAITATLFISSNANATLLSVDLFTAGDGLATLDTSTGLEWLDLNTTLGIGTADILNPAFTLASLNNLNPISDLGFNYADPGQIVTLFTNAGIPDINVGWSAANYVPVDALMQLVSTTGTSLTGPYAQGYSTIGPLAWQRYIGHLQLCVAPQSSQFCPTVNVGIAQTSFTGGSSGVSGRGHWLIRSTSIPEPTSLILMGIGLVGLGLRRKRIR